MKLSDVFLQSVCWNNVFKNELNKCCGRHNMAGHVQVQPSLKHNTIQRSGAVLYLFLYCVHRLICWSQLVAFTVQLSESTAGNALIIQHIPISLLWNIFFVFFVCNICFCCLWSPTILVDSVKCLFPHQLHFLIIAHLDVKLYSDLYLLLSRDFLPRAARYIFLLSFQSCTVGTDIYGTKETDLPY